MGPRKVDFITCVFGDPCVISSPTGDFYYFHLSDPEGQGWRSDMLLDRIVCQHQLTAALRGLMAEEWGFNTLKIKTRNGL